MKYAIFLMALSSCLGCATVTTAHNFQDVNIEGDESPIETVMIENTGWTMFKILPIGSGNPEKPDKISCCIFRDTTTLQNNLDMLEREMKRVGATRIRNLSSKTAYESLFLLLFTRTACRTSAVLLK